MRRVPWKAVHNQENNRVFTQPGNHLKVATKSECFFHVCRCKCVFVGGLQWHESKMPRASILPVAKHALRVTQTRHADPKLNCVFSHTE